VCLTNATSLPEIFKLPKMKEADPLLGISLSLQFLS
jgi:hypothetical protein